MDEYLLSQICVILSVILLASTYFVKNKKVILIIICLEAFTYGLQYVFLHQYAGAILNMTGIIRCVWFYVDDNRCKGQNILSLAFNFLIIYALAIITYHSWIDCIALIGTCYFTFLIWQKNIKVYRWGSLPSSLIWLFYNIMVWSILGIVLEVILFIVELIGAILITDEDKINRKKENNSGKNR